MATRAQSDDVKKLGKLIEKIETAMLTTATEDGSLRSRPMQTQNAADFDGTLWFFTDVDSAKVFEVEHERHVNVSYADPGAQAYVSVSGRAGVSRNAAKVRELWTPAMKAWFPGGIDDPKLALLQVNVDCAEYWDTPSSKVVHLIGFAKAILTGDRYEPGDHAKVNLENA